MKTVLITGTTSGIGYSLSKLFADKGFHVILISRNADKLIEQQQKLQHENNLIDIIACDLQQAGAAKQVFENVQNKSWKVDILINNAGFNEAGMFTETKAVKEQEMLRLHVSFVTEIMKLFIPLMIKQGKGFIMNVGSTGSYIACPNDAVYAASKAYILHLSRAINSELKGSGVSITTLCPGSTQTEFAKKAGIENTLLFKLFVMHPDKVAKAGYKAMNKGKSVIIPGLYNKLLVFSSRILPYSLVGWMTKKML